MVGKNELERMCKNIDSALEKETSRELNQWLNKKRDSNHPPINNMLMLIKTGGKTETYQRILAIKEFQKLMDYIGKLELENMVLKSHI